MRLFEGFLLRLAVFVLLAILRGGSTIALAAIERELQLVFIAVVRVKFVLLSLLTLLLRLLLLFAFLLFRSFLLRAKNIGGLIIDDLRDNLADELLVTIIEES